MRVHLISTVQAMGNISDVPQAFPYIFIDYLKKFKVLIPFFSIHHSWGSGMKRSVCFMMKTKFDNFLTVCSNIIDSPLLAHNYISTTFYGLDEAGSTHALTLQTLQPVIIQKPCNYIWTLLYLESQNDLSWRGPQEVI